MELLIKRRCLLFWDAINNSNLPKNCISKSSPKISFKVDSTECHGVFPRLEIDIDPVTYPSPSLKSTGKSRGVKVTKPETTMEDVGQPCLPLNRTAEAHQCLKISIFGKVFGELLLCPDSLHFRPTNTHQSSSITSSITSTIDGAQIPELLDWWGGHTKQENGDVLTACVQPDGHSFYWKYSELYGVYQRTFLLDDKALEIFGKKGSAAVSHLVAFETTESRDAAYTAISDHLDVIKGTKKNNKEGDKENEEEREQRETLHVETTTRDWLEAKISNFDYLLRLNQAAGRSFHDVTQYPVFPVIIKDMFASELDLTSPTSFRDLSKPMGSQDDLRASRFKERYNELVAMGEVPYHYGSHFSNASTALYFLMRLEPFARLHRLLHDGKFDLPDRLFHDLKTTWSSSATGAMQDVKELLPELFYNDEALLNRLGLEFGTRQNHQTVHHVDLPNWAKTPRHFVYLHRRALESSYVTQNLPLWVDLIFGFKQRGKFAVDALNVFHPLTYGKSRIRSRRAMKQSSKSTTIHSLDDCVSDEARQIQIMNYGQMPVQLFPRPHPLRKRIPREQKGNLLTSSENLTVVQRISTMEPMHTLYWNNKVVNYLPKYSWIFKISSVEYVVSAIFCYSTLVLSVEELNKPKNLNFVFIADSRLRRGNFWKISVLFLVGLLRISVSPISQIISTPHHNILISVDHHNILNFWDTFRLTLIRSIILPIKSDAPSIVHSSPKTGDVAVVNSSTLLFYTLNGSLCFHRVLAHPASSVMVTSWEVGVYRNVIVVGHVNGHVSVYDTVEGNLLSCKRCSQGKIHTLALIPYDHVFSLHPTDDQITFCFASDSLVYECVCRK
ncbi:hypothetical protein GEMRC1_006538 [Eukaryota sp. GEM-RC1]